MLAEITRHSRFTAEEFEALATEEPVDVPALHRRIRSMIVSLSCPKSPNVRQRPLMSDVGFSHGQFGLVVEGVPLLRKGEPIRSPMGYRELKRFPGGAGRADFTDQINLL
jgi:hypothetical protein